MVIALIVTLMDSRGLWVDGVESVVLGFLMRVGSLFMFLMVIG
jgi:hypothetical protein